MDVVADPDHPQHDDMLDWIGGDFDPSEFDPAWATDDLRSPRPFSHDEW